MSSSRFLHEVKGARLVEGHHPVFDFLCHALLWAAVVMAVFGVIYSFFDPRPLGALKLTSRLLAIGALVLATMIGFSADGDCESEHTTDSLPD